MSNELTNLSGIYSRQEKVLSVSYQQCFSMYEFLQQIFLGWGLVFFFFFPLRVLTFPANLALNYYFFFLLKKNPS